PVVYVPQGAGLGSPSQISSFLVRAAWHTVHVFQQLESLKAASDPMTAEEKLGYPLRLDAKVKLEKLDNAGNRVPSSALLASDVDALIKHVGYENIPFDHSIGMLTAFLNIFYPTDNTHTGELLGYYRQREWRLIGGGLKFNNRLLARALGPS